MNILPPLLRFSLAALGFAALSVRADVIETKNGARLVGTVSEIDGTSLVLSTDYAGDIKIKLDEIVTVTTDAPLVVRLEGGTVLEGRLAPTTSGQVQISGSAGNVTTPIAGIARTWAPGDIDPDVLANQRGWTYEAALDINGKTGNSEQLGTSASFRAILDGRLDKLQFYTAYNRQESDEVKSADQFRAGIDYANNFSGRLSWYARDEGGFDRIKNIDLYNVAAAGFGYDVIQETNHTLTTRAGLSFRYEGYRDALVPDVKSAGLDFGLMHRLVFERSVLQNSLSYVPSFDDFGNFRAIHDSHFETPITASLWKLRVGVGNDYNSEPGPGIEKLDTTFYTRLVLNWR